MFRGKVTAVDARGVYVLVPDLHPTVAFGPCQWAGARPAAGATVLCVDVGDAASPDVVIVGRLPGSVTPPAVYTVGVSGGYGMMAEPAADLTRELDIYRAMGVSWLRIDVDWSAIESTEGVFDWSTVDRVVAAATGFQILGVLAYSPLWATSDTGETHAPPTDLADYTAFCAAAATRYAGKIAAYEIWNEPNHEPFWTTGPDPAVYTDMVQAAYTAIKAQDSEATVIAGALSPAVTAGGDYAPVDFTAACYTAGISGSFDAWSVHPYCYPASPDDVATIAWNTFQRLPLVHDAMVAAGDTSPIWLTEFGAPTGTDPTAVTEAVQAAHLATAIVQAQVWDWVEGPLFFYSGRDRGSDPSDREQMFGFIRVDWTSKVAHPVLTAALRDGLPAPAGVPTGLVVSDDAATERYVRFQTAGEDRWTVGANPDAEAGADAGSNFVIARYDDDGVYVDNPLDASRADGSVSVNTVWIKDGGVENADYFRVRTAVKPAVTGSKGGNAALGSLLTALASLGLITDSTT